jgi:hypothetical protein
MNNNSASEDEKMSAPISQRKGFECGCDHDGGGDGCCFEKYIILFILFILLFFLTLIYPLLFMFIVCYLELPGLFGDKVGEYIATAIYMIGFLPALVNLFIGIRIRKMINSIKIKWFFISVIIFISFICIVWNFFTTGFIHYRLMQ